jgi:hypothetical protein
MSCFLIGHSSDSSIHDDVHTRNALAGSHLLTSFLNLAFVTDGHSVEAVIVSISG